MDEIIHLVPDIHDRRKGPKHKGMKEFFPRIFSSEAYPDIENIAR